MKRILTVVLLLLLTCSVPGWGSDNLMKRAQTLFKPIPTTVPVLKKNPITPEKVKLGRILYFDPRLSSSALISCNTCHNLGMGGIDFQETSVGHGWRKGPRNAPTVFNAVFNIAQFWDGRAPDLKEQAKGPVQASVEMNSTPERVISVLKSMPEYVDLFQQAFPGKPGPVTFDNMARAIETFEATLLTPDSPFDQYLKGNSHALDIGEKEGLQLFIDRGCSGCHNGMNIGGSAYFPFGVVEKPDADLMAGDEGRLKVTGIKSDAHVFKVPSLRNVVLTPPYFHSGKVWSLKDAVRIMATAQLGLSLTDEEVGKIVRFLKATTGAQPRVEYPVLPAVTDKTPRPKID
ncbi:MAG: cytochrome-c peroxidase [Deltaproteobacteria bacterium]|nr:cytochrome-c peroxidase [Deltaproteobacteria bacterium]